MNSSIVELAEVCFSQPVKIVREAPATIWNNKAPLGARVYLELSGMPKVIVVKGDVVVRSIPYHMVSSLIPTEERTLTPKAAPKKKAATKKEE